MKRFIYILAAIFVAVASSCINEDMPERADVVHVGDRLPNFSVTMNSGELVTGESLREGVSVVIFFHTSCSDCQQLLPQIEPLYNKYTAKGVAFALISREEGEGSIAEFWADHNLTMPYSPQGDRAVYNLFARSLIPRVYISDNQGVIRYIFADNPVPSYEEIESALESLL